MPFKSIIFIFSFCILYQACQPSKNIEKEIFRYNQGEGLTTLDPAYAKNMAIIWATRQIFDGLLQLDEQLNLQPNLAVHWQIDSSLTIYTFYLKSNVYFHKHPLFGKDSTRLFTAYDVKYSFTRIADPKTASSGSWIFNGKIKGINEFQNGKANEITGFKVINDTIFQIHLIKPYPPFLYLLTMPYAYIVPHEIVAHYGKDFRKNPIGTGPFVFKFWKEGVRLVLHKNPYYHEKDSQGRPLPYLKAVEVSFIRNKMSEFLAFKQGKIDFISGIDESFRHEIIDKEGNFLADFTARFKIEKSPYLNTEYIGIRYDTHTYNKNLRAALSMSIDRNSIVKYLKKGIGKPATGLIPDGMPYFKYQGHEHYTFDLNKAKLKFSTLKQKPKEITLYTNKTYAELAEYIQRQWQQLGLSVKIILNDFATHQEMVYSGKAAIFRASWIGDYPDPENYMALLYSKYHSPAGPNTTHFTHSDFDRDFEAALNTKNQQQRSLLYARMEDILAQELPIIPIYFDEVVRILQKNVEGLENNPMNLLLLKKVRKK
ncbi:MAG: ABC transporter substrate-binding protein [Bacteroidia bacterium]|nr:ABC transporter substrate-binding protein [Bacteroidia bacterium]MDW8301845.1 ABC transporter substrate-binding protein [Bacteroidia bacterium]